MNAEALIGTVLGTCTLQRLIGQGGMGAVYLAQQSRPRRQVAVKILLPATSLKPHQFVAFLERFRRETDAAASLEHPNIMPVHEYGEYEGLAYLVMPYISGGTLRDVMEAEGSLTFLKTVNYLDQMAAALDFAHERGVIHRDIKPANMLLTPEERLLLTDFGLVKILTGGQTEQSRLTGAGAPVGTPDYMSPEQVMGDEVDGRADLYSLGVILYQMVTGVTPFQGETPMQIAAQQLHMPPAPPRMLRSDLPVAAEQVILKALAKNPSDRYACGQDMVTAFRMAVASTDVQIESFQPGGGLLAGNTGARLFTPKGLFDPSWQTDAMQAVPSNVAKGKQLNEPVIPKRPTGLLSNFRTGATPGAEGTGRYPASEIENSQLPTSTGSFSATHAGQPPMYPPGIKQMSPLFNVIRDNANPATPPGGLSSSVSNQPVLYSSGLHQMSPTLNKTTGAMPVPNQGPGSPSAIKLTGPVKVVQVPVAGQPGQFMTGLLPVLPSSPQPVQITNPVRKSMQLIILAAIAILIILGSGVFTLIHLQQSHQAAMHDQKHGSASTSIVKPDLKATALAQASATARANILLTDPLSQNIHNFPTSPSNVYKFTGGAYHITDQGNDGIAVVLQERPFSGPIGYTLTMQEIKGDDTSANNSFGMILRFNQQSVGGKNVTTFYSFEVVNVSGGEYRFYKYDNSQGSSTNPWTELWHQAFGREFHQGQGSGSINTFKVFANGSTFNFTVNGKSEGSFKDGTFKNGTVGMLVNLNGTEVAFSKMLITRN